MEGKKYLLGFTKINGLGPIKLKKIIEGFASLEEAWQAGPPELIARGFSESEADKIITEKSSINPDQELEQLTKEQIEIIDYKEIGYPKLLKEIYDPPPLLFFRGKIDALNNNCLAVIGARKHSDYGRRAIEKIIPTLAQNKITIISGLALGIDAVAHQTAIDAGGLTVGVLGSDLLWNNIGPKNNFQLAKSIIDTGGCLISEYPPGTQTNKSNFPRRNRLVSGLSKGILVIEAGENSGTLITANYALEQNREVFAVPGNIFAESCQGTNNLIKRGAKLTTSAEDIINEFFWEIKLPENTLTDSESISEIDKIILDNLSEEATTLDKLSEICNLEVNKLNSRLMLLELSKRAKNLGNGRFIKLK